MINSFFSFDPFFCFFSLSYPRKLTIIHLSDLVLTSSLSLRRLLNYIRVEKCIQFFSTRYSDRVSLATNFIQKYIPITSSPNVLCVTYIYRKCFDNLLCVCVCFVSFFDKFIFFILLRGLLQYTQTVLFLLLQYHIFGGGKNIIILLCIILT